MIKQFLSKIFFILSPVIVYKIIGNSMLPQYKNGDMVFARKLWFSWNKTKDGDVVIAKDPRTQRLLLKRIKQIKNKRYFLVGDNDKESTDSRGFGSIEKQNIIAKVFFTVLTDKS